MGSLIKYKDLKVFVQQFVLLLKFADCLLIFGKLFLEFRVDSKSTLSRAFDIFDISLQLYAAELFYLLPHPLILVHHDWKFFNDSLDLLLLLLAERPARPLVPFLHLQAYPLHHLIP